ncbi:MAG: imidazole glycerol phosphate synthase subunit HisH [Victivallales bacterium]|nr:imidazole glycerol phosphate synthase subunit HisH [Victivallales bacterium]
MSYTAIIDYGAGNCTSVASALAAVGGKAIVTRDARAIMEAERVVFPGVGAAKSAMDNLMKLGLADVVRSVATSDKPFLGICLGMQILFEYSEEDGGVELLGLLPGRVRRFPDVPGFKIPEIGWNQVNNGKEYYFVHSYYAELGPYTIGTTEYAGVTFTSSVRKGKMLATQFHPEKSGKAGLELLKEFLSC